jgi:hypothetical protein
VIRLKTRMDKLLDYLVEEVGTTELHSPNLLKVRYRLVRQTLHLLGDSELRFNYYVHANERMDEYTASRRQIISIHTTTL